MSLPLDELFRRLALAKGDLPSSADEQHQAQLWYRQYVDQLTQQLREQAPGELAITHESVQNTIERAYREYRRREGQAARRRLL